MKKILSAALVVIGLSGVALAASDTAKLDDRIAAAHAVLHELMDTPDKGIPLDVAAKAHCVAVIPSVKKGAFIVGAEYGQGVATCRTATWLERAGVHSIDGWKLWLPGRRPSDGPGPGRRKQ